MRFSSSFAALCALIPALASAAAISVEKRGSQSPSPRAAYMLSDDPNGAFILAFPIDVDTGLLSLPKLTPTGGLGMQGINISSGTFSPNDPLFTQDGLIVSDNYLLTVNAGSHTLTLMTIDPKDPTDLTLISTTDTLGEFPCSVAYSPEKKIACVANGGVKAGMACFSVSSRTGLTPITALLDIGIHNQTTPPIAPFDTISDIVFSPSGNYVMVSTKGPTPKSTGFFHVFPVSDNGTVASTPIVSQPEGFDFFIFGFSFLSERKIYATDANYGGVLASVDTETYEVTVDSTVHVPKQVASCWTSYAPQFNSVFLADACQPNITVIDPVTNELKGFLYQDVGSIGSLSVKLDRHYLYVLKGVSTISVTDLRGLDSKKNNYSLGEESLIQTLDFSHYLPRAYADGLVIYPAYNTAERDVTCD